jgi:hypothetical protein
MPVTCFEQIRYKETNAVANIAATLFFKKTRAMLHDVDSDCARDHTRTVAEWIGRGDLARFILWRTIFLVPSDSSGFLLQVTD